MKLKGKKALVTGSSRGIGRAIAIGLAKEGADIAINYRKRKDRALEVSEQIRKLGRQAEIVKADVGNPEDIRFLIDDVYSKFGRIDILVNNAGIAPDDSFLDMTLDSWEQVINVNLRSAMLCSQYVARKMVSDGIAGIIINVSSVNAFQVEMNRTHYNVSKAGMDMLIKSMAVELGPYKIRVNGIAPGVIKTEIGPPGFWEDEESLSIFKRKTPLKRIGQPEDCVGAVVFLASDESSFIQGQTILIDGGLLLLQV